MKTALKPEIKTALIKGALVEAVCLFGGAALFLSTGSIWWLLGGSVLGAATLFFFLQQVGTFDQHG